MSLEIINQLFYIAVCPS